MRNLQHILTSLSLAATLATAAHAQTPNNGQPTELATSTVTPRPSGRSDSQRNESPESARQQVMQTLNLFRNFSVNVDAPVVGDVKDAEETTPTEANFGSYLSKVEKSLQTKLKTLETDAIKDQLQRREKSSILRGMSIVKSARCLVDKKDGQFARLRDLDGNEVIGFPLQTLRSNPRYGLVEDYKEGFSRIKKDQVFGFLNYCGDEVVPCQFQQAERFNDGKALVKKVDWYFIDSEGNESDILQGVVNANALFYGISLVTFNDGKQALIDNNYLATKTLVSAKYDAIEPFMGKEIYRVRIGKKFGLIDINGNVRLEPNYENIELTSIESLYRISSNGKVGLMDNTWTIKFRPEFDLVSEFNRYGLAYAKEGEKTRLISARTFKSSKLYEFIGQFDSLGQATMRGENKLYGLIDSSLRIVLEPSYMAIESFNKFELAKVQRVAKQGGFINREGKEVIAAIYDEVNNFNTYGLVVVRETLKDCDEKQNCKIVFSVFDKNGNVVLKKEKEDSLNRVSFETTEIIHSDIYNAIIAINETQGSPKGYHLVDIRTLRLINPTSFDIIGNLDYNRYFAVRKNKLWGLMDTLGKVVVKPQFEEIAKPSENYYAVRQENGKWGYVDKKGKTQIPFEYESVSMFRGGFAVVSKGKDKFGAINRFNAKVAPCTFREVKRLDNGQFELIDNDGQKYMINAKGDCELNCQKFEEIRKRANQN